MSKNVLTNRAVFDRVVLVNRKGIFTKEKGFAMQFGVQIVSIAVLVSIVIGYTGLRKLPILSTKWFERFLKTGLFNYMCEVFSLITLYYIDVVPAWLTRLAHQFHMGSLVLVMHTFLLFVDIKGRNQKRYSKKEMAARLVPLLFTIPVLLLGEVNYVIDGMTRYSYGTMVTGIIVILAIYIISEFILVFHFRKVFSRREMGTFIFALGSWVVIAAIQTVVPSMLLTSMGIALMAMNVFMSFENPREYADHEVAHALNKSAFLVMVNEHIQSKKEFYIVNMTLTNSQLLKDSKGYFETIKYMEAAALYLKKYASTDLIFHPKRDTVSLIYSDKNKYYTFMEEQRETFVQEGHDENGSAKYFLSILKCPQYAATTDEVVAVMDYVDKIKADFKEAIVRIDENVLDKKTYYAKVESLVQNAIETDAFDVYYQPIYSNKENRFVSAEALVRLADTQTLGYVSPEIFIPIAEENGMICELGHIVFRKVCKFISEYNLAQYGVEYMEVNLSGAQFMDNQLNEILLACAKEYNVPPEFINLEITETASIEIGEMLEYNMKRLKECRFRFSMDDFGTGYSNLAKIAQGDFDLIKLDKSLLWPCFGKEGVQESRVILDSSIRMIHDLGKQVVAEGVETQEMVDYLTERDVRYLQGYYFSRPLPEERYIEFMKEHA